MEWRKLERRGGGDGGSSTPGGRRKRGGAGVAGVESRDVVSSLSVVGSVYSWLNRSSSFSMSVSKASEVRTTGAMTPSSFRLTRQRFAAFFPPERCERPSDLGQKLGREGEECRLRSRVAGSIIRTKIRVVRARLSHRILPGTPPSRECDEVRVGRGRSELDSMRKQVTTLLREVGSCWLLATM